MPRQARLDSPGLLHHVMARGLNRQKIFLSDHDRDDFLHRVDEAHKRSPNQILAWALMPNHVHFLIRSGAHGLASFMRRLLSGYAVAFNKRHQRVGYLYQGRFKSLVCEEDPYFLMLLRYIHLNPVVGGLVRRLEDLKSYPYSGHRGLMGRQECRWQAVDEALGFFGRQAGPARKAYVDFLAEGLPSIRKQPTDCLGAGLLRRLSHTATHVRRESDRSFFDSRILGDGDFVAQVWQQAEARDEAALNLKRRHVDLRAVARTIAEACQIDAGELFRRGRRAPVSAAKAVLIHVGIEYLGLSTQAMASATQMSGVGAGKARTRGRKLIERPELSKLVSSLRPR